MVATPTHLFGRMAVVSAFLGVTLASSFEYNPRMPLGEVEPLTPRNPAFGAVMSKVMEPIIVTDPTLAPSSNTSTNTTDRQLEELPTNWDIQKIEYHFNTRLLRNLKELKPYERAQQQPIPWTGSYWAVYKDGINFKWDGNQPSAAEKYARAFNKDVKQFMDAVSRKSGVLGHSSRPQCTSDNECSKDGSKCGKRHGEATGHCIPGWFGICHAWAPAAILEPEPKCAVTKNGVTFKPFDLKALMTQLYDGAAVGTVFTGARYDGPSDEKRDKYNRFRDPARRDLGPGFLHVAMLNLLGRFKTSFVLDVDPDAPVWNQPIRSYNVLRTHVMSAEHAADYFFHQPRYPFNKDAKRVAYTQTEISWILEDGPDAAPVSSGRTGRYTKTQTYEYLLELDERDNIIGGEWIGESMKDHPDFLWFSVSRPPMDTVTDVGLRYRDVRALLDASVACRNL